MQSNLARGLIGIASIAVIVVLFIVVTGDDDESPATTTTTQTTTETGENGEDKKDPKPEPEPEPKPEVIEVAGGEPVGGVAEIEVDKGDQVLLEIRSDTADEVHVHGYDLMEDIEAGGRVNFDFTADIDGIFEVELEGTGVEVAELTVNP